MSKRVVLNFGGGSFETGFPSVTAELWETNGVRSQQLIGSLPSAPEIITSYREWKLLYNALAQRLRRSLSIDIEKASLTNVSQDDLYSLCQRLQVEINSWLNTESFRKVDQKLRTRLSHTEEIRVVIETSDDLLWRLPWHLWEFVEDYPQSEVVLSLLESKQVASIAQTSANEVRVLAILGDSRGIDISTDITLLKQLPGIVPTFLLEPDRKTINDALWQQTWDILFFAGHSSSQAEDGKAKISINQNPENHTLTITQLEYALSKAIEQGLQLAIFNSCDGLGLAKQLAKLNIPQIIVMREDVPNAVAQEFLKYFLAELARGESIAMALRGARKRLQGLENEHPCASWLPVICQNSISELSIWQKPADVQPQVKKHQLLAKPTQNRKRILIVMMLVSFIVSSLVMGVRYLGWLQSLELYAFDRLMQTRSQLFPEQPDNRLLIVTIDDEDITYQNDRGIQVGFSLSDQALAKLLQKLDRYQPKAIGLDIYHDATPDPKYPDLATRFQKDTRLVTICKVATNGKDGETKGINPPPEIPKEQLSFSDFVQDKDKFIRRHLLQMKPPIKSRCGAEYAFSVQLAFQYLNLEGKQIGLSKEQYLQIEDVVFKPLEQRTNGYQKEDTSGSQLLLNYRSLPSPNKIAEQVSLRDILSDSIRPELVNQYKNRIIIIGRVAHSLTNDFWKTPFNTAQPSIKDIPGVYIQAQMVSQIISAVLDSRPLLWWWSSWIEILWVWAWSFLGAILAIYKFKSLQRIMAGSIGIISLWSLCFVIFTQAGWIPLIPALLVFFGSHFFVVFWLHKFS